MDRKRHRIAIRCVWPSSERTRRRKGIGERSRAPLLYVSNTQINAVIPFAAEGQGTGAISVEYNSLSSENYTQGFTYYAPAIFSAPDPLLSSARIYARMLNQDGTLNSEKNAGSRGHGRYIYATGTGVTTPVGEDGKQAGLLLKSVAQPLSAFVNGNPVEVLYAGTAPFLVEGTTQINFRIPTDIYTGGSVIQVSVGPGLPTGDRVEFFTMK